MPLSRFQPIRLTIVAGHGEALPNQPGALFDAAGGSIGRAADNHLVLADDDDDATIARHHARLTVDGDAWLLANTSEHAAIAVNGKLVAPRERTALRAGDIVNIGAYVLRAEAASTEPAWDQHEGFARNAQPSAAHATDTFNPLRYDATPTRDASNDRPLDHAQFTPLHDLLDTPLDPLALFGAPASDWPGSRWNDAAWHDPSATDLFDDLGSTPGTGFESPPIANASGHAIRDDVPEFDGHLHLPIAAHPSPVSSETTASTVAAETAAASSAATSTANANAHTADYANPFARLHDTMTPVVRVAVTVPDYSGKSPRRVAHQPGTLDKTGNAPPASFPPLPAPPPAALIQAFLEGAGIAPSAEAEAAVEAGLTPKLMHTLGALVRALRQPDSPN
nr:hypothetical protein HUO10_001856 [Paraburkholderia busanensis]